MCEESDNEVKNQESYGNAVYVDKWLDDRQGGNLGFQLSDRSLGVFFNDSTEIVTEHGRSDFYYIERPKN